MADSVSPGRRLAAFLTGQVEDESAQPVEVSVPQPVAADAPQPAAADAPPAIATGQPRATDVPLIPSGAPRPRGTRVVRPASVAASRSTAPPVAVGPSGEEIPIIALPDYAAPPGAVVSAGYDANGIEYVFEDDPGAEPLVDPRYDADDRNWVSYRPSWGGALRLIGLLLLVVIAIVMIRNRTYAWIDDQVTAGGDHGDPVAFTIPDDTPVNSVATDLANAGVINNATVFRYWLRCEGDITITGFLGCDTEVQFQAGDYDLVENMTYEEVVAALDAGPKEELIATVLVPEGLRVSELVERLLEENDLYDRDQLLEALADPEIRSEFLRESSSVFWPHEGLLFPAQYDVPEQDLVDERSIISRMSSEFDARFVALLEENGGLPPIATELGLDEYDIVVIASLIEKEAKLDEERAMISRVIWNRLQQGWLLGVDATACYAPNIPCSELTVVELEDPNPWNTRQVEGLPPTPIAAPGEASLAAALAPADGPWMYYVLTNEDGSHTFATTEAEFEAARQVCIDLDLGCG